MKTKVIKILILVILLLCMTSCGREEAVGQDQTEVKEKAEGVEEQQKKVEVQETTTAAEEAAPAIKEIPIDFPFWAYYSYEVYPYEELNCYSLILAQLEEPAGEYELRLYHKKGKLLQQISCGELTEPLEFCFDSFDNYSFSPMKDLEIFPADSSTGLYIGWDGQDMKFSENAIEIPKYEEVWGKTILTVEEEGTYQVKKVYQLNEGQECTDEVRRWKLNKATGELEIWDSLGGENLFKGAALLDEEGNPVNKEYYDMLLWEDIYDIKDSEDFEEDTSILLSLDEPRPEDGEWGVEYESREALLTDLGFGDSEPMYECYDWHHNLRLELYMDESMGHGVGITYSYYIGNGKKCKSMEGFTIDYNDIEEKEWSGEDAYSKMSEFDPEGQDFIKDYEEIIEYTPSGLPDYFASQGRAVIQAERGEESLDLMEINYIYRDDDTLFYREYHHSTLVFPTNDSYLYSLYDEKGRVIYERGYITNGHVEKYYIYEDEGDMPAYYLWLDYGFGFISPYVVKYH